MVVRGCPEDTEKFYTASDGEAFRLQQMGLHPMYFDGDCSYFKKSNKLKKALAKLGIDL